MLSPALTRIQDALFTARASAPARLPDLATRRAGVEAMAEWGTLADGVRITPRGPGVPGVRVSPIPTAAPEAILYVHGGGYFGGSPRSHLRLVSHIVARTGRIAHLIDYRLAPECPFPAAVDDVTLAYRQLVDTGHHDIVLIGDSAGGGLALASALGIRDQGLPRPAGVAMLSPWLDLSGPRESIESDPVCSGPGLEWNSRAYLAGRDPRHPYASPLFGNLSDLPPLYLQIDVDEILWADTVRLKDALSVRPGALTVRETRGLVHTYQLAAGVAPEADLAIGDLARWMEGLPGESLGGARP